MEQRIKDMPIHPEVFSEHGLTESAVRCLMAIGDFYFTNPLASHPWGGRPHVIAWRAVRQKYLTEADIFKAYWMHEREKRINPNWFGAEVGMTYLRQLMDERSGNQWREEYDALKAEAPKPLEYAEQEFGPAMRAGVAQERRKAMHLVTL